MARAAKKEAAPQPEEAKEIKKSPEDGAEDAATDSGKLEFYEKVGNKMEVVRVGGRENQPAMVYAGEGPENTKIVVLSQESIPAGEKKGTWVNVLKEGQAEAGPKLVLEARDRRDSFDKMLDSSMEAAGIDPSHAEVIRAAAEARKPLWMVLSAREDKGAEFLADQISTLIEAGEEKLLDMMAPPTALELETRRREQEQALMKADTDDAMKKSEMGRALSAYEAGLVRRANAAAAEKAMEEKRSEAETTAEAHNRAMSAEGFVELMANPLYDQGPESVRARIKEIEEAMDAAGHGDGLSDAEQLNLNMMWDERKRHMAVLPTLEKFENLEKKSEEVDAAVEAEVEEKIQGIKSSLRSVWGKIGNRVGRVNVLNKAMDRLNDFANFWEGYPAAEEASEEMVGNMSKIFELQGEVDKLREEEEYLKESGVFIEFDVDAALDPARTELYTHLVDLAKDGDADAVGDYIEGRLDQENLSDEERSVLEKALNDIDNRTWIEVEKSDLFEMGEKVNIEIGNLKIAGEIMGFQGERPLVQLEGHKKPQLFNPEYIVKVDAEQSEASAENWKNTEVAQAVESLQDKMKSLDSFDRAEFIEKSRAFLENPEASEQAKEAHLAFLESEEVVNEVARAEVRMSYREATAKELDLRPEEIDVFKEYYDAMSDALQAQGLSKEAFQLPENWDDFLSAKKSSKGAIGWLKRKFGVQSEQKKMLGALIKTIESQDENFKSSGVPESVKQRLAAAKTKLSKTISIQMPGSL